MIHKPLWQPDSCATGRCNSMFTRNRIDLQTQALLNWFLKL